MQLPHFAARGLDLSMLHAATLNVDIAPRSFSLVHPEYTFAHVKWSPDHPAEDFSFSPCRVAAHSDVFNGYVYWPHPDTKPAHFQPPTVMEIVAPFIPGIEYGQRISLELLRDQTSLT